MISVALETYSFIEINLKEGVNMKHDLSKIILGNWGGIRLNAKIDEDLKDVKLMIKYSDHGDEFLIVKTENEIYEYGWWLNRKWEPEYDDLIKSQEDYGFIRKPELFCAFDNRCRLANEIYFHIEHEFYNTGFFVVTSVRTEYESTEAQRKFDRFIEYMENVYSKRITYENTDSRRKVEKYLECNGILTQENIEKLDAVKWTSRINGVDGFAGKKSYSDGRLVGDEIEFIYYKGKFMKLNEVKIKCYLDRDYFERFNLSLKQFK